MKNSFLVLILFSYGSTAISMEQPNTSLWQRVKNWVSPSESQPNVIPGAQISAEWRAWEARRDEEEAERNDKNDIWSNFWWPKTLAVGVIAKRTYELLSGLYQSHIYQQKGFTAVNEFIQNNKYLECAQTLKSVQQAMPISKDTYIEIDNTLKVPCSAATNLISINPALFTLFDEEGRCFLLGHESRHVYNNDLIMTHLWMLITPLISYGILKAYNKGTRHLLTALQKKVDRNSKTYRYLRTIKTINTLALQSPIAQILLNVALDRKFQCWRELCADRESSKLLNNVPGSIRWLKKLQDPNFLKTYAAVVGCTVEDLMKADQGSFYPLAMRIKALEALQKKN